ncbi:MAG: HDOD domain-containing protein [Armatimonadetes bacterium]|nr:HDOD domain-containing protein [Armatimonadota bacterium]MBS1701177.1 HDOD domain-containing protein [Armatimonadota bacterium]MBS1725094.1 HDOD domain-containing protein [Armatimonadota bacterium]
MWDIKEVIKKASDLPSMPEVAFEVIRIADQADSSASTVAATLSRDPSLSARVLRLANSAFYGMARDVHSIQEAVVVLGMRTTKSLSLVAASFPWLQIALKGKGLSPKHLWNHCLACAYFSKMLAMRKTDMDAEQAFCIGLLHDIGTVALYLTLEDEFTAMTQTSLAGDKPFDQIERETLSFDHAELGATLAESWNLPKAYCRSIRFHHRPSEMEETDVLTDIIHIADIMVRERGIHENLPGTFYVRDEAAFERLGVEADVLNEWLDEALSKLSEAGGSAFAEAA